eukprot:203592_1
MSHKLSTQDIDWEMDTSSLRKHLLSLTKPKLIKLCKSINVSYTNTETKQEMVNMLLKQKHSIKSVKHKRKSIQKTDSKSNAIESNYFPKGGYPIFENKLEPIARILLIAVYDDNHPLSIFRGMRYIIKAIWELVLQFNKNYYSQCIEIKDDPFVEKDHDFQSTDKSVAFKLINESALCASNGHEYFKTLKFPYPLRKEININMMPIKMSYDINKLKAQIPSNLQGYIPWIGACLAADHTQKDKICFLTIHESYVQKGNTQRRPGIHIELPGMAVGGEAFWFWGWGNGYDQMDGIYIASNVSNSCAVWNVIINERNDENNIIKAMDEMGGLDHLKAILPNEQKYMMDGGKLYWITDRTPHEALPMKRSQWRQFFRLVSHKLGVWYEAHSTKNPKGIKPNPKFTKIVKGNKFKKS